MFVGLNRNVTRPWISLLVAVLLFLQTIVISIPIGPGLAGGESIRGDGTTIYVDATAPEGGDGLPDTPFNRIQDAVDVATDGDIVEVSDGAYYENVVIPMSIEVRGMGSSRTFLDAENGIGFLLDADDIIVSGFGIIGSSGATGVRIRSDGSEIRNVAVTGINIGIHLITANNNTVESVNSSGNNHGIYLEESSFNLFRNNEFYNNSDYGLFFAFSDLNANIIERTNEINGRIPEIHQNEHGSEGNPIEIDGLEDTELDATMTNLAFIILSDCSFFDIHDITVTHSDRGIVMINCEDITISHSDIVGGEIGMLVQESTNVEITQASCSNLTTGIRVVASESILLEDNVCGSNENGIVISASSSITVRTNLCDDNERFGIHLRDGSTKNFLAFNGCHRNDEGIVIDEGSSENELIWNECSENFYGISVKYGSSNATLTSNTCSNNMVGIFVGYGSERSYLDSNKCHDNTDAGIQLFENANDATIIDNFCDRNTWGIRIGGSTDGTVQANTMIGNSEYGIFMDDGMLLDTHIDGDNEINGKNPEFHFGESGTSETPLIIADRTDTEDDERITNMGYILLYDCEFFSIRNISLSHSTRGVVIHRSMGIAIETSDIRESDTAIDVRDSRDVNIIDSLLRNNRIGISLENVEQPYVRNVTCEDGGTGIILENVDNGTFRQNDCNVNSIAGFHMTDGSSGNAIDEIASTGNTVGMIIEGNSSSNIVRWSYSTGNEVGLLISDDHVGNIVWGCNISGNSIGVSLQNAHSIDLTNNSITFNTLHGVLLNNGSSHNLLGLLNCSGNRYGIYLGDTEDNTIRDSSLDANTEYGVYIASNDLRGNLLLDNTFNGNTPNIYMNVHGSYENPFILSNRADTPEDSRMINLGYIIIFECSNITLMNFTITHAENAVYIGRSRDISISDIMISDIRTGIVVRNSTVVKISNSTVSDCLRNGIDMVDTDDVTVHNTIMARNDAGLSILRGEFLDVTNVTGTGGTSGIVVRESSSVVIVNASCNGNKDYGLYLSMIENAPVLINITASVNLEDGIYLDGMVGFTLTNATLSRNLRNGLLLNGTCIGGEITGVIADGNSHGINLSGNNDGNSITANTLNSSKGAGIVLNSSSDGNWILQNSINGNKYGIHILDSWDNVINNNTMDSNTRYGIMMEDRDLNGNLISTSNLIDGVNPRILYNQHGTEADEIRIGDLRDEPGYGRIMNLGFIVIFQCSYMLLENISVEFAEMGIFVAESDQVTIKDSSFTGIDVGIMFANVTRCFVHNVTAIDCRIGVSFIDSVASDVTDSTFRDNEGGIVLDGANGSTVRGNECTLNRIGIRLFRSMNTMILLNDCSNNQNSGISVEGFGGKDRYGGVYHVPSSRNLVEGNNLTGNAATGIMVRGSANTTIEANEIGTNGYGIFVEYISVSRGDILDPAIYVSRDTVAHNNTITGNTIGANAMNNLGVVLDATLNWWGSSTGPTHAEENPDGTGDDVSNFIEFNPWTGKPKTVYNQEQDTFFYTIQEAVDLAHDGETIRVHEGVYIEEVEVYRAVSIIGNGTDKSIIRTKAPYRYLPLGCPYQFRITADGASVSGLLFQGNGISTTGLLLEGGWCRVMDTMSRDHLFGILLDGATDSMIINNTYSENGMYGINVISSHRNTFSANTIDSSSLNIGINLHKSTGTTLEFNAIQDIAEIGIAMKYAHDTRIRNNSLVGCNEGIKMIRSNQNIISGNTITDCAGSGIILDMSTNNRIDGNELTGSDTGILAGEGSSYNTIESNLIQDHSKGISLLYTGNVTILRNNITNNAIGLSARNTNGLIIEMNSVDGGDTGILLYGSRNNILKRNTCSGAVETAIDLTYVGNSILTLNIIGEGNGIGISVLQSHTSTIVNNTIFGNDLAIRYRESSGTGTAWYNNIIDNTDFGITSEFNNNRDVNAEHSFWGASSGPYHPTTNPSGAGDRITDHVEYQPHSDTSLVFADIESITPPDPEDDDNVTFVAYGYSHGHDILRYSWWSSLDGEIYDGIENSFTTSELTNGSHRIHLTVKDSRGIWSEPAGTILFVNGRPIVDLDDLAEWILEGEDLLLNGNAYDDGEIVLYKYSSSHEGIIYQGKNPTFLWEGPSWGNRIIYFQVMDDLGTWSDVARADFGVYKRPKAFIDSIDPQTSYFGEPVSFQGHGVDDIGISTYQWRDGTTLSTLGSSSEFVLAGYPNGTHVIEFRVRNVYQVWSDWVMDTITIRGRPVAEIIGISPNPATSTDVVTFSALGYDDVGIDRYV